MAPRLTAIRVTYQALIGVAIAAALLLQFTHGIQMTHNVIPYVGQFFSYFTILTNMFVASIFLYETFARNKAHSVRFDWIAFPPRNRINWSTMFIYANFRYWLRKGKPRKNA